MTPKSSRTAGEPKSKKFEFTEGMFDIMIDDDIQDKSTVSRVRCYSGKVYYDLNKYRKENNID
ncbi:MAG: hypothetical protein R3A12_10065 [Ignavibacteria bacterium]